MLIKEGLIYSKPRECPGLRMQMPDKLVYLPGGEDLL